jgi:hypothetical protein
LYNSVNRYAHILMIKKYNIVVLVFIFSNILFAQNAVALIDTTICKGSVIKLV